MTGNQVKSSAIDHYNQGRAKHNIGQYAAAIVDYNTAIRLKPDHALVYYDRGFAKYHLGQYEDAIADYDNAIRLKPDFALAYYNQGLAKERLGQTGEAEQDWRTALKLATQAGNVKLKNKIESVLYQTTAQVNLFEFAISSVQEKVIQHNEDQAKASDSAAGCFNRGLEKYRMGQYDAAIIDYDTAIQLQPDYVLAYNNRGLAKYYLGQYDAAIADYDNAIRLKSDYAAAYNNRGLVKAKLKQYDAAIIDYDTAIQLQPDYVLAYNNRGLAKYYLGQYESAIADYDNVIRLKPDDAYAYYDRGLAKYYLGQYDAAILDYDNTIQLEPNDAKTYYNRGLAKAKLNQYDAAITDYDNAIRLEPNDAAAYYDRGLAKEKLGQTSKAEQDWRTALKLATQAGNVKLKNKIESVLLQFEPRIKASESLTEKKVKEIVADYFGALPTASPGYSVKREYLIQMGSSQRRADIVFLRNGKLIAIAECKRTRRVEKGNEQLHSYLCATDTFLGIFANNSDPNKWTFWENHRHNNFLEIDRETFENYVYNHDEAIKDRENKIKEEIQREIDAEIKDRVRKNTNMNAIRQNETDRIKQEAIENIDKTAIVNSVRSQIAQQAENGLLNERDKANRKRGREQGFWWTIFSLIGIGILIALLITSAA